MQNSQPSEYLPKEFTSYDLQDHDIQPEPNPDHPLRPKDEELAKVWDLVAAVPDPEIPVISIADLGILRSVTMGGDGRVHVVITPTYSGCPAMDTITDDVTAALNDAGHGDVVVDLQLQPAWTTDWLTQHGRDALEGYGIAPPSGDAPYREQGPVSLTLSPPVSCPRCKSLNTRKLAHFGSTSCKALYSCNECHEPFDYFKVLR